jgi:soluble lytic murein transglycosylase-like protein
MRIQEIFNDEEWQRLEQLIYASTYKALAAYQQQRATQQRIATKPAAALKPQAAKTAKALARKAKRIPYAAAPKPLPKPNPLPQAKAEATPAYRPVKTAKPLPPTTRKAMARPQSQSNKAVQQVMPQPPDIDQAGRRMLPRDKQGPNPTDLLSLDERG